MTHFGLICPPASGHLNPMTTLGHELNQRGNRVTLVGTLDARPKVLAAGLEFRAVGEAAVPAGATTALLTNLGELSGLAALRYTLWLLKQSTAIFLEEGLDLDAQLVIALGGGSTPESLPALPGSPLVVGFAPQLELLQQTTLTITHAGMNTALESLSNGVPMVAIPIANDQPGVAARIAWTGTGEVVPLQRLSVPRLRSAIKRVLKEDSYKKNALRIQEAIKHAGGVKRAADIIEQVVATGKPIMEEVR